MGNLLELRGLHGQLRQQYTRLLWASAPSWAFSNAATSYLRSQGYVWAGSGDIVRGWIAHSYGESQRILLCLTLALALIHHGDDPHCELKKTHEDYKLEGGEI